jgi:GTP-binding protein LepA
LPAETLFAGEIGYIATGIKEPNKVRVGDTIMEAGASLEPLPGYQEPQPMIFASLYPENPDEFDLLKTALLKLKLNDPSLTFEPETKEALGRGFRCGFLGTLHVEIVSERLRREFNLELIISSPSVVYKIIGQKGEEKFIYGANDWPDLLQNITAEEPWASLEVITPSRYMGRILDIFKDLRGNYIETKYISPERVILTYEIALSEIIANLYDKLKSASQGYASMSYKVLEFRPGDLVKMEILIAGEKERAFSKIVPKSKVHQEGKRLAKKIKENLPSQQFSVAIQAVVGGNIVARETLKARRKDVVASLYGGDYSRKRKLLEKQKKGKKKLKQKGNIRIPSKVFLAVFKG